MGLRLFNTLSRRKEEFRPLVEGRVGIYSCGPTVYRDVHIGNLRTYLLADWLRRVLLARGLQVTQVKNITDVGHMRQDLLERGEDKVVAAALAEGRSPGDIAHQYTQSFLRDEADLNILPADVFPKATEHVPQMVAITERLVDKGLAYVVAGNVYFDVARFPDYGALSGNRGAGLEEGVRVEVDPLKRDPRDFTLWKAAEPGRMLKWPSPWGDGFPGWHIECSAMSTHYLGERFDLHTGGVDNVFPHHEDEIAQSEGAFGHRVVGLWVHGQHLLVDGLKMAKSTGNVYTLQELKSRGFDPLAFRLLCLTVHYRHRLNFTLASLRAAQSALNRLRQAAALLGEPRSDGAATDEWRGRFDEALDDDLALPRALALTCLMLRSSVPPATKAALLLEFDRVLGLGLQAHVARVSRGVPAVVREKVTRREAQRAKREFAAADALRSDIEGAGYRVRDTRRGTLLVPAAVPPPEPAQTISSSGEVASLLRRRDAVDFSVVIVARDEIESARRCLESVLAHAGDAALEVLAVDNGSRDGTAEWLRDRAATERRLRVFACDHNLGTGAARNIGLKQARGRFVVVLDTSVEVTGDVFGRLAGALADDAAGIVGGWGVSTADLRDFAESDQGEVDAVEGYLMAFRRSRVGEVGLLDEKYRFYRHLDLDYSFAFRARGYRNRQIAGLPLRKHAHSDWSRLPEEERDRLSKRNFYRFLHKWGTRTDLLVGKT